MVSAFIDSVEEHKSTSGEKKRMQRIEETNLLLVVDHRQGKTTQMCWVTHCLERGPAASGCCTR